MSYYFPALPGIVLHYPPPEKTVALPPFCVNLNMCAMFGLEEGVNQRLLFVCWVEER